MEIKLFSKWWPSGHLEFSKIADLVKRHVLACDYVLPVQIWH